MSDQQPGAATDQDVQDQPVTGGSPTDVVEQAVDTPDWQRLIEQVDPNEIRKHPRVAGIVGEMVDKAVRKWANDQQERITNAQRAQAEKDLLELAERDPLGFSKRFLTDKEQERLHRQFATVQQQTREEFARRIGRAFQDVPEWKEFTAQDYEALAMAVQGKPDDEIIAAYNAKAAELIADKRAEKRASERYQKWRADELEKEVDARVKDTLAKRLKRDARPDLRPAAGAPAKFDPNKLSDSDFNQWYEKNVLAKV